MRSINQDQIEQLYEAFLKLNTKEECRLFLEDLCTIQELKSLSQRLETAKMLKDGKNYKEITKSSDISTATISRVSRCLNYGSGGYEMIIDRLKEDGKLI